MRVRGGSAWLAGVLLTALLAVTGSQPVDAQQDYVPTLVEKDTTPLWFANDFARLEAIVAPLRSAEARTPSGAWMLAEFYRTFHQNYLLESEVIDYPDGFQWKKLDSWAAAFPDSPTPHILRAMALTNLAKLSTRSHIITPLPESGWQPHLAYAREARELLEQRSGIGQQDPYYYVLMVRLLAFAGADLQDLILAHAEAAERWPLYDELHIETMDHLAAMTSHNNRTLTTFANTVHAASAPFRADETYARLIDGMAERTFGLEILSMYDVSWPRMRRGLEQMARTHPTEDNKQRLALYACLMGDRRTAMTAFQSTSAKPVRSVWRKPQTYQSCRKWSID